TVRLSTGICNVCGYSGGTGHSNPATKKPAIRSLNTRLLGSAIFLGLQWRLHRLPGDHYIHFPLPGREEGESDREVYFPTVPDRPGSPILPLGLERPWFRLPNTPVALLSNL